MCAQWYRHAMEAVKRRTRNKHRLLPGRPQSARGGRLSRAEAGRVESAKPRSLQRTEGTIKPSPIRPAVESGFTIDDFAYDDQTGTLTCPNGVTRPLSAQRRVTFGAACQGCPLRDR